MADEHDDDVRNVQIYQELLERHGENFRALDWGSSQSQRRRFEILAELGFSPGDSLLDLGCGLGDLYDWIVNEQLDLSYTGIDITPALIERARLRFPGIDFEVGTIFDEELSTSKFDYIVASGIFAHRINRPELYLEKTVARMFSMARKAVAFNTLSDWSDSKEANEFHAEPLRTLEYCRSLTPFVALRHDYHLGDFTIYLRKQPAFADNA